MTYRTVFLAFIAATHGLSARAWLSGGRPAPMIIGGTQRTDSSLELPLIQLAEGLLLPGEMHVATLTTEESAAQNALKHAEEHCHSCIGLLLLRGDDQVSSVTSLLEIERLPNDADGSMRVQLACVGRVELTNIVRQPADEDDFLIAAVEPYVDDEEDPIEEEAEASDMLSQALDGGSTPPNGPQADADAVDAAARAVAASAEAAGVSPESVIKAAKELLANLDGEVASSYEGVMAFRRRLAQGGLPAGVDADAAAADTSLSLDERVSRFSAVLDESTYADLWAPPGDTRAVERQLVSFLAAAACPKVRSHALLTSSTTERLSASLCALREEERRLAAMCALRGVSSSEED